MKKTNIILIALCLLFFSSCEKVVEFNVDTTESQLVMIANPQTDSLMHVRLSYSRFFLDNSSFRTEDNATMTLNVNGTSLYSPISIATGVYSFAYRPQPGDTLTLRATVAQHEPVFAGTRVPDRPIVTVTDSAEWVTNNDYNTTLKINFHLKDNAKQHNFYRLRIYHIDTTIYQDVTYQDTTIYTDTNYSAEFSYFNCSDVLIVGQADIASTIDGETSTYSNDLLFSDENINGTNHEISINVETYYNDYYGSPTVKRHYFVVLESLSYDRYQYLQTCYSSEDDMAYFSEPTQIYCNVVGGIGSFAASTQIKKEIAVPNDNSTNNYYYKRIPHTTTHNIIHNTTQY